MRDGSSTWSTGWPGPQAWWRCCRGCRDAPCGEQGVRLDRLRGGHPSAPAPRRAFCSGPRAAPCGPGYGSHLDRDGDGVGCES
ncbi:excalibur calcium-binding domain-containing protein [Rhodococcoides corynebacterioides]|uniref:excalibur calcium-binding domain-containing protein n=1 Tax=Rhodococcoides corynebacterioides TaxID=53972 RepID=UPI00353047C6